MTDAAGPRHRQIVHVQGILRADVAAGRAIPALHTAVLPHALGVGAGGERDGERSPVGLRVPQALGLELRGGPEMIPQLGREAVLGRALRGQHAPGHLVVLTQGLLGAELVRPGRLAEHLLLRFEHDRAIGQGGAAQPAADDDRHVAVVEAEEAQGVVGELLAHPRRPPDERDQRIERHEVLGERAGHPLAATLEEPDPHPGSPLGGQARGAHRSPVARSDDEDVEVGSPGARVSRRAEQGVVRREPAAAALQHLRPIRQRDAATQRRQAVPVGELGPPGQIHVGVRPRVRPDDRHPVASVAPAAVTPSFRRSRRLNLAVLPIAPPFSGVSGAQSRAECAYGTASAGADAAGQRGVRQP